MAGPEKNSGGEPAGAPSRAERWLLKYGDRIYGPYSVEAMKSYIAEGRVIAQSVIAPEGTLPGADTWQPAARVAVFAESFGLSPAPAEADAKAEDTTEGASTFATPAREERTEVQGRAAYGSGKGQTDRRRQPETANFLIVMDIKARFTGPLEQAIMSLGPAYKLAPNVWCVNTNGTAAGLLNDLSVHIGKTDSMFIVDATRDRTAWNNLGPETDAKIRRVWRRPF